MLGTADNETGRGEGDGGSWNGKGGGPEGDYYVFNPVLSATLNGHTCSLNLRIFRVPTRVGFVYATTMSNVLDVVKGIRWIWAGMGRG